MLPDWNILRQKIRKVTNINGHIDTDDAAERIKNSIWFQGPNVWILAFSIVIASVGLNVNSTAVIIGAMLISPLMGPIIGIGLSLGTYDFDLLREALKNLLIMVLISLAASTFFFLISPLSLVNATELEARTSPTIYDVLIALFGGLAGILENSRKERGTAIAGVAIATALMPPLCTAGYGLSCLNAHFFFGALYLFIINTVFITLATFVSVRYLLHFTPVGEDEVKRRRNARWITVILIILLVPSVLSAIEMIKDNNFARNARILVQQNKNLGKSFIYDYHTDIETKPSTLELYLAGEKLESSARERLFLHAEEMGITRAQIVIHEDAAFQNEMMTESELIRSMIDSHNDEIRRLTGQVDSLSTAIEFYKAQQLPSELITREIAAQYDGVTEVTLTRGQRVKTADGKAAAAIVAIVRSTQPLQDDERERIEQWLRVRLGIDDVTVINK